MADGAMVWVPTVDGGTIQVPVNDPRATALLSRQWVPSGSSRSGKKTPDPSSAATSASAERIKRARTAAAQKRLDAVMVQITVDSEYLDGIWEDPENRLHDQRVITLIALAIENTDRDTNLRDRIADARVFITLFRERSPRNARSVLLRDAERYLWGRAGIPQFVHAYGGLASLAAPVVNNAVYTPIKAVCMMLNASFHTSWGLANPMLPFSPLGGDRWFQLGIAHYHDYDAERLNGFSDPYEPTTADVAARLFPGQARPGDIRY